MSAALNAPGGAFSDLLAQQKEEIRIVGETFDYSLFAGAGGMLSGPGSAPAVLPCYYVGDVVSRADLESNFDVKLGDAYVLLAYYDYGNYEGTAFVIFLKDGVLYEVNGSHCSCYGLEGQWQPEETSVTALRHRMQSGQLGHDAYHGTSFRTQLKDVLDALEP